MILDQFAYTAAVEQLRACKSKITLEELVRKYSGYYNRASNKYQLIYSDMKWNYKLFVLAMTLYSTKYTDKLPTYLYKNHVQAQTTILHHYLVMPYLTNSNAPLTDYTELLDMFEFDAVLETPEQQNDAISALHSVVLNNQLPFKLKFNQLLSYFDTHSMIGANRKVQAHIHAIRLKQTLSPNKPATVLDQYVADTYAAIKEHKDVSKAILRLKQQTKALKTYQRKHNEQ